jgi:hypothetical protein
MGKTVINGVRGCRSVFSLPGGRQGLADDWRARTGVPRMEHFVDCKLCNCAAHDENLRNGAPKREKWKEESGKGKRDVRILTLPP